jgi:hypothetical protein
MHHCRWRAAKLRPMFDAQGLRAERDLYCATPAVTRDISFSGLIRRTTPFRRLLRHTRGCRGFILTRILTGSPISCLLRHTRGCGGSILTRILTGSLYSKYGMSWGIYTGEIGMLLNMNGVEDRRI